jgi:YbgC/YbaW family acyl-CoA thioester hydrolase
LENPVNQPDKPIATHRRRVRVGWSDLDAAGRVTLSQFVRWMEETEYEFLRSRQLSVSLVDERGQFGFPRLNTQLEIAQWPDFDEVLEVELNLRGVSPKQLDYDCCIYRTAATETPTQMSTTDTSGVGTVCVPSANAPLARVRYQAACCRFPANHAPYAILIPDWVLDRLGTVP